MNNSVEKMPSNIPSQPNLKTSVDMNYVPEIHDIVIIKVNGFFKKRHIYNIGNRMCNDPVINKLVKNTVYDVDYGLGLTSEGSIVRSQIIRKATEDDKLIPL